MKNMFVSTIVIAALACPVVYANDNATDKEKKQIGHEETVHQDKARANQDGKTPHEEEKHKKHPKKRYHKHKHHHTHVHHHHHDKGDATKADTLKLKGAKGEGKDAKKSEKHMSKSKKDKTDTTHDEKPSDEAKHE